VKDLRKQNICLLAKWWWKLRTKECLWQQIVQAKHLYNKTIANVKNRFNDSLNKGYLMRFWKDPWLDGASLQEPYPLLFDICQEPDKTFMQCAHNNFNVHFRRRMNHDLAVQWQYILIRAQSIPMSDNADGVTWSLKKKGTFTTKSIYKHWGKKHIGPNYKGIWKAKNPLKIKIYLWQTTYNAILTRGNPACSYCNHDESRNHLFLLALLQDLFGESLGRCFGLILS
jgi:hypothetical protein